MAFSGGTALNKDGEAHPHLELNKRRWRENGGKMWSLLQEQSWS